MHHFFFIAALFALTATSSVALAQVPPDIAEGIRKIGPINDPPGTAKLYAPLFSDHKEPYSNVTVVRDIAYGTDPLEKLDVFTAPPTPGAPKPVVIFIHGGGFERGDKGRPGSPFYDNIMLWLTRQGMVGVNMNHRLAPKARQGRIPGWISSPIAAIASRRPSSSTQSGFISVSILFSSSSHLCGCRASRP